MKKEEGIEGFYIFFQYELHEYGWNFRFAFKPYILYFHTIYIIIFYLNQIELFCHDLNWVMF